MDVLDVVQQPQAAIAIDQLDEDDPFVHGLCSLLEHTLGKYSRQVWPPQNSSSLPCLYAAGAFSTSALKVNTSPPPTIPLLAQWFASLPSQPCAILLFRPLDESLIIPHLTALRSSPALPFIVVLYSAPTPLVDSRVASIRKSASLDPRSLLFLSTAASKPQLTTFVQDLVLFAFSAATEHCTASFKRLRKDRYRKPPTGIQDHAWAISVEYRLGYWAELKGEWDLALSHYAAALHIFSGVSAADRQDADELGDILILRICKLYAYLGQLSTCGIQFYDYLRAMKTSASDQWIARRYELFGDLFAAAPVVFPLVFASENTPPESHFGNSGMAYFHAFLRLRTSQGVGKNYLSSLLAKAKETFVRDEHFRMALNCEYHMALIEYDRQNFLEFLRITDNIVPRLMESRWLILFEDLQRLALRCALADFERQLKISVSFLSKDISTQDQSHLLQSLLDAETPKLDEIEIDLQDLPMIFLARVTCRESKAFVGSSVSIQFVLSANIHAAVDLSTIRIEFYGSLKPVEFRNVKSQYSSSSLKYHNLTSHMSLEGGGDNSYYVMETDLYIAPDSTLVLEFAQIPREVGEAKISSIVFTATCPYRIVRLVLPSPDSGVTLAHTWYKKLEDGRIKCTQQPVSATRSSLLKILPKRPKIKVDSSFEGPAFVGEIVPLKVSILNEEDENITADIVVRVKEELDEKNGLSWSRNDPSSAEISKSLGVVNTSASVLLYVHLIYQRQTTLELVTKYSLPSDPSTLISKSVQLKIQVISPFRETLKFLPRASERESAAVFDLDTSVGEYVTHYLYLVIGIMGVGPFDLEIDTVTMKITKPPLVNICISPYSGFESTPENQIVIKQMLLHNTAFEISIEREIDLKELVISATLEILWRRVERLDESHEWIKTIIAFPQLNIPNLYPTVVAQLGKGVDNKDIIPITYHFDNPTFCSLDLLLNAESNEAVAYAGARKLQFRLLPQSSYTLQYNLLPITRDKFRLPLLRIIDRQTDHILRVIGVGEHLINDPNGIDIWYHKNPST